MAARQVVVSPSGGAGPTRRRLVAAFTAALLALVGAGLAAAPAVPADAKPVPGGFVEVQPDSVTLTVGGTQQLRASVMNPTGFELPNRRLSWTTSDATIAMVDDSGVVTGVNPGQATVTAKSGAALGTATVTVNGIVTPPPNAAPTVTITAPSDGATFTVGDIIDFAATAVDPEDGDISDTVVWTATTIANPDASVALGTGAAVSSTSLAAGTYLVTAQVTDTGELTDMAQVGITVDPAAPPVTARVDVTGGTLDEIGIIGLSGAGSQYCYDASTCEATFALPSGVQVQLSASVPFDYVCPGEFAQPARQLPQGGEYLGGCQQIGAVTKSYNVGVVVTTAV
jgi:hypothetical protein